MVFKILDMENNCVLENIVREEKQECKNDTNIFNEKRKYNKKTKLTAMEYIKECFKYAFVANIIGVFAETFCRIFGHSNCKDTTGALLEAVRSMNSLFAILAVCLAIISIGKPVCEKLIDYYLSVK